MAEFTSRFERLELKFLIDELMAASIRAQIQPYCQADPHTRGKAPDREGPLGYVIHSLYLDSPGLAFHRAKERGDPDRVKLRIRTYSESSPAILEIKRRHSDVIDKTRGVVDRRRAEAATHGFLSDDGDDPSGFFEDFALIAATSGAAPTLSVRYEREAYESVVDDYARVTFDRHIAVQPMPVWNLVPREDRWIHFDDHWKTEHPTTPVVLEVKCQTDSLPRWVIDLIHRNGLCQTSFSKYSIGIHLVHFHAGRRAERSRSASVMGAR